MSESDEPGLRDWVRAELAHARAVLADPDIEATTGAFARGRLAVLIEVQARLAAEDWEVTLGDTR